MNLLVVSQFYSPDNFKVNEITAQLVKRGHAVHVLTGLPDYSTGQIPREYRFLKRRREVINGVSVTRVPTVARRRGAIFRALNYLSFALSGALYTLFAPMHGVDVVLVYQTSPVTMAFPAVVAKNRLKKPLLLYCMDLWPESVKAFGFDEKKLLFKIVHRISNFLLKQCDAVAISSTPFEGYLRDVNGYQGKLVHLPQHAEDMFSSICGQYDENGCIDFLFAGNIGAVQDVECILKAVSLIKAQSGFKVHIVGDGSSLEACKKLAEKLCITDRVIFHGRHPLDAMESFYKMADCFLLTLRGSNFIGLTLPGKAQGYLCAGKPIVGAIDGAASDLIHAADCGLCAPAGDAARLAASMTEVVENFEFYRQKGLNGRKFYEENFTLNRFMEVLIQILTESKWL